MQHITTRKLTAILIILFLFLFFIGCEKDRKAGETAVRETTGPRSVKTATVTVRDIQPSAQATGTMVPRRHSELHALVDGQTERLPVDIGERVKKGQLLYQIRTVDHRLALQQAERYIPEARREAFRNMLYTIPEQLYWVFTGPVGLLYGFAHMAKELGEATAIARSARTPDQIKMAAQRYAMVFGDAVQRK